MNRKKHTDPGVDANLARHGGLSYLEIPSVNPRQSALFYTKVLGWKVSQSDTADPRFADQTGHLIGRWVISRTISRKPGLLPYFYVNDIEDAAARVIKQRGKIVKPPYAEGNLWVAIIRDPTGNTIGLWQEGSR